MTQLYRNSTKLKLIVFALPFLLGIAWFSIVYRKPLYLISQNPNQATIETGISTKFNKGTHQSTLHIIKKTPQILQFKYILNQGEYSPRLAVIELKSLNNDLIDLSHYQLMNLRIKATKGRRVQVVINGKNSNVSEGRIYVTNINVGDKFSDKIVELNSIITPYWWYSKHNQKESTIGKPDFSEIKSISIANCVALGINIEDQIEVAEWSFQFDIIDFLIKFFSYTLIYFLLVVGIGLYFKNKAEKKVTINYAKIDWEDSSLNEVDLVLNYIKGSITIEELSITMVENGTGVAERRISAIIKETTGYNFKYYINQLRIESAKELLSTTDLSIGDIAFKVGYRNVSHFNRVFKESINCSPKEFKNSLN